MDFYTFDDNPDSNNNPRKAFAIASLVCGIGSILGICCFYISPILGILSIIFAFISRHNKKFDNMAIAGLVTGIIGFVFGSAFAAYTLYCTYILSNPEANPELYKMLKNVMDSLEETETTTKAASILKSQYLRIS